MPKNTINYQKTIIYKIVCNDLNIEDVYVGHTTNFVKRKQQHKENTVYENGKHFNNKIYCVIRENGGWNNWIMLEIEKFPCNDVFEAKYRERYWYENLNSTLNTRNPIRGKKEYAETHKSEKQLYDKEYRKKLYHCECGSIVSFHHKNEHLRTKKHEINIKNKNIMV